MLNIEVTGNGAPLVFLHGYGEDLTLWRKISVSLSTTYQIILVDLPGFGKSESLKSPFSLEDIAHHIIGHLMSTLHLDKFVLLGHSLGGYIALTAKELYPNAIIGFGLINSNAYADTLEKKALRDKTIKFIVNNGAAFFLTSFVPNLFLPSNQKALSEEVEKVLSMGSHVADTTLISYMAAMRDRRDSTHLLEQSSNILFIAGRHDQLISIDVIESQIMLIKSKANVHIFDDVAHMSMLESPIRFETAIADFIKNIRTH